MTQSRAASTSASSDIDSLVDWISSQTGLSFRNQRETATETVRQFTKHLFAGSVSKCRSRLENDQAAFDDLIGELTIGETYFFRDEQQFELIADEFLNVMKTDRPAEHRLRLWSAACASGEEAWTLAAVLTRAGLGKSAHVLGTDISRVSLAKAREGSYGKWSLRESCGERMRPWVTEAGRRFEISDRLRSMVSFEYLNLAADQYPSFSSRTNGLDLILCRNVLIYFDKATVRSVAERLFQCLAPDGWLMTGASDPVLTEFAPFEVQMRDCGHVYVRPKYGGDAADESSHSMRPVENQRSPASGLSTASSPDVRIGRSHQSAIPSEQRASRFDDASGKRSSSRSVERLIQGRQSSTSSANNESKSEAAPLEAAQRALEQGDLDRVLELTRDSLDDLPCSVIRVRALASLNTEEAAACCADVVRRHRVSPELNYLHAILLSELDRDTAAAAAARSAVFLDQKLIVGHLALGNAQERLGQIAAARRSFRNALKLAETWPANQPVPCSDGESAERLAQSAARHIALLGNG